MPAKIVTIGGGGGHSVILRGFNDYSRTSQARHVRLDNLTCIVSTADDGGSTGKLIDELGVVALGDIRICLSALAAPDNALRPLFEHRFRTRGALNSHSLGNLVLAAALEQAGGDLVKAISVACSLLGTPTKVLPSTEQSVVLCAELADGWIVRGENALPERKRQTRIKRMFFEARGAARPDPEQQHDVQAFHPHPPQITLEAIAGADVLVFVPGSLFTSTIPNLIISEISQAIRASTALKIYVCNVVNQPGETDGFTVGDYLDVIEAHGGFSIDLAVVNTAPQDSVPGQNELVSVGATDLRSGTRFIHKTQLIEENLLDGSGVNHNALQVASILEGVIDEWMTERGNQN